MFRKKKRYGFNQKKMRTIEEINKDYNFHATQAGHKARIVQEIESEIEQHLKLLKEINLEASKLPKVEAAPPVADPDKGEVA